MYIYIYIFFILYVRGGHAPCWSRNRFPMVSLDFSVTYYFRPYHGSGVDSAPSENEYQEHSWGKGGRCVRLTTSPPSCAICHENLGA